MIARDLIVSFDILSTFVWVLNAAQFLGTFVLYFPSDLLFGAVLHHRICRHRFICWCQIAKSLVDGRSVPERRLVGSDRRMSAEDMECTVSSSSFIYDQLRLLGVSESVWDDVFDELFDEPFGNIPGTFGCLLADLNGKIGPRRLDYSRPEGCSDHEYVRRMLRQSIDELSGDPELPDDDGSDCAKVIEEYWSHRSSLN
jgi:hypothetical protein